MRSLGSIRARVERLAAASLPAPETVLIHWKQAVDRCPACGADLEATRRRSPWPRPASSRRNRCSFGATT
jgi:hypothetical protein